MEMPFTSHPEEKDHEDMKMSSFQGGAFIVAGFKGKSVSIELKDLIKKGIAGVVLFTRNYESPEQIHNLCHEIQSLSKTPLFIFVDQEGGRVLRLKEPFTPFPSMRDLGLRDSELLAYSFGKAIGEELSHVGINAIFSPVLDVNTNPMNLAIGDRSMGKEPHKVARLGRAIIRGLRSAGLLSTGKHFPGHGDTLTDSHHEMPVINHSIERLKNLELIPFIEAIREGVNLIMTAHILYTSIDNVFPATLSRIIIRNLLREELGFRGLVITDDMEMGAIVSNYSIEEAAVLALKAGCDLVLICHDYKKQLMAIEGIEKAIKEGRIDRIELEASHRKIETVRRSLPPIQRFQRRLFYSILERNRSFIENLT